LNALSHLAFSFSSCPLFQASIFGRLHMLLDFVVRITGKLVVSRRSLLVVVAVPEKTSLPAWCFSFSNKAKLVPYPIIFLTFLTAAPWWWPRRLPRPEPGRWPPRHPKHRTTCCVGVEIRDAGRERTCTCAGLKADDADEHSHCNSKERFVLFVPFDKCFGAPPGRIGRLMRLVVVLKGQFQLSWFTIM